MLIAQQRAGAPEAAATDSREEQDAVAEALCTAWTGLTADARGGLVARAAALNAVMDTAAPQKGGGGKKVRSKGAGVGGGGDPAEGEEEEEQDEAVEEEEQQRKPKKKSKTAGGGGGGGGGGEEKKKGTKKKETQKAAPGGMKAPRVKKDKNAPKKALSSFMCFANARRAGIREENPDAAFGEMGKLLGEAWKALAAEGKREFEVGCCCLR